ncbi:45997_t:CDS:2 [Gigaspora margarita]|uniref:45997_t:CDS:1 n=1 Tax=Gigaspora margarita TaxID=4874 RepID=A0ABN7UQ95_GIGMA|nr:45997_t:CDS:2 [Gigaspora margarita]
MCDVRIIDTKKCQKVLEELRKRLKNECIDIFFEEMASEDNNQVLESITEENDLEAHIYQQYLQQEQKKLFEIVYFCKTKYDCQVQALWNYNKWNLNFTLEPCNLCDNCYTRNKENAKVVNTSTEVLKMLDIVEILTTNSSIK